MIENFNNFRIRCGLSTELLDQNGQLKAGVKVDLGCWYLCIDTACVYICIADVNNLGKAKLELLNAKNFAGKSELSKYAELAEVYTKGEIDALGFISEIPDEYLTLEQLNTELDGRGFITEHQSLANYATKAELLEAIKAIPQPDLTDYAKKSDIPDTSKFITEIPDNYVTEEALTDKGYLTSESISGLASTDYVDEKFAAIEHPLTGLATEEFVTEKIAEIEIPDVSNFATKDELPSVAGLATESFVHEMIAKAELGDKDADLDAYYTKDQVDTQIAGLATKEALAAVQQQSAANNVKLFAVDEELVRIDAALETIPSIEGLASEQFVIDKIDDIEIPSVTGLASETYVDSKVAEVKVPTKVTELDNDAGYITEHQDISHLATKEGLETVESKIPTLDGYAKLTDIPSTDGFASEQFVTEKIAALDIPDVSDFITMPDVEAKGYATEAFVANKIAEAELAGGDNDIDFSGLATKDEIKDLASISYVDDKFAEIEIPIVPTNVSEFENDAGYITAADIIETDLSNYYNKTETEKLVTDTFNGIEFPTTDLTGYAKEEWVKAQGYITDVSDKADSDHSHDDVYASISHTHDEYASMEHDHSDEYAAKEHTHEEYSLTGHKHDEYITDISGKADVGHRHDDLYEVKGTAEAVKNELLNGAGAAYDTLKELGDLIANNKSTIEALETVATGKADKEHSHDEYALKEDLADLASKSELPTLTSQLTNDSGYITTSDLPTDYLVEADLAEYVKSGALSDMATKTWVGEQGFITNIDDKADKEHTHEEYLTAEALTGYSKFSGSYKDLTDTPEIPSIEGLASTSYVDGAISTAVDAKADKEHKHDELYDTKGAAEAVKNELLNGAGAAYDTLKELGDLITTNKDALDALSEIAAGKADKEHSHEEYAEKEHTHDQYITDISGKADVVHTHEEYAAKDHTHEQYLTEHQDISGKADKEHVHEEYALKSELPSTAGLASEEYVANAIAGISIPEVPTVVSAFTNDAGYISADALNAYATAGHTHEDLATKTELADAINNIQHPQVDLTGYATAEWVEGKNYLIADDISGKVNTSDYQADRATFAIKSDVEASLAGKLDSILFTENYLVKNPIGNLVMNTPVMGMSLKDILINMLGLELYIAPSLPENVPEETPPVVSDIIANSVPVHTLDGSGNLVVTEQTNSYVQLTPSAAKEESDDAYFYQIVDPETNELIESGYQIPTVEDSEDYMTVAIPETVTAFHVEQFNPLSGDWERVSYELVPTDAYTADGYIVYTADGTDGGPTIRIVID